MKTILNISRINVLILIQLLATILVIFLSYATFNLVTHQTILIFLFVESVFISFVGKKFNIFQIFLITLFTFIIARIFFDFIGIINFNAFSFRSYNIIYPINNGINTLKVLSVFLSGISLGWLFTLKFSNNNYLFIKKKNSLNYSIYRLFFYFFTFLKVVQVIIIVVEAIRYGYVNVVQLSNVTSNILRYFKYVDILFNAFGLICLFYSRNNKDFKKIAYIYMIPILIFVLTGQRGQAIYTLLLLMWMWNKYYKNIKFRKISLYGIVIIIGSQIIELFRKSMSFTNDLFSDLGNIFFNFFNGTGTSLGVIQSTIYYEDSFVNKVPFFFGYFIEFFHPVEEYTIASINNGNYLAYHLSYMIIGDGFFYGYTIGTSIIAEFYELVNGNLLLIALLAGILVIIAGILINKMYKNLFIFSISFLYLARFIYSPRDSIGKIFTRSNVYMLLVIIVVVIFEKIPRDKIRYKK